MRTAGSRDASWLGVISEVYTVAGCDKRGIQPGCVSQGSSLEGRLFVCPQLLAYVSLGCVSATEGVIHESHPGIILPTRLPRVLREEWAASADVARAPR